MKDDLRYLFIGDIPILMPKHSVARQWAIENCWLNPKPLAKEVGVKTLEKPKPDTRYVV